MVFGSGSEKEKREAEEKKRDAGFLNEGGAQGQDVKSLQYDIFREEEKLNTLPKTIYEKATHLSEKIIPLDPDKKTAGRMQEVIEFAHLNITPRGVISVTFLAGILFFVSGFFMLLSGIISLSTFAVYLLIAVGLLYYLYTYPFRLKKIYELRVGSEIVMMILHMVIFMRNCPNLEGAVKFASSNLSGPLALDMKKLMWDVRVGTYDSMEQGLLAFTQRWKGTFRSFSDSVNAIIYSLYTSGKRRFELLDESVDIILDSLSERSNSYITKLKSPIALVNALGILLPIMVLTMLPIITMFLSEIPPSVVFGCYDVFLPMLLLFIIKNILDQRVVTLPEPDLSLHPDLPPDNMFLFGKFKVYSVIPALLILLPVLLFAASNLGYLTVANEEDIRDKFSPDEWGSGGAAFLASPDTQGIIKGGLYRSYFVTFGLFLAISVYFLLNSFQKLKYRREILEMEDEFREVLFGLGQEIDRGIPIEVALTKIAPTLRGQYAVRMIERILDNINYKSMTFDRAVFDEKEGAIRYFPSKLIHSVMKALTDAVQKGTKISAEIMISISRYLSDIHKTQEIVMDRFSEILGSMKMQAQILLPLICAIMSVITYMMTQMTNFLGTAIENLPKDGTVASYTSLLSFFSSANISPAMFQLAVGVYAIETVIILSWFMNGIIYGTDKINLYNSIGRNLIVGGVLYLVISLIAITVFSPFFDILKFTTGV
ncbi:MAG: hypothetical protein ACP5E4_00095 [Candidatus Aenigmatarchaeota archaeon]